MLPNALSCRIALRLGPSTPTGRFITTKQVEIRPTKSQDDATKKKQEDPEEIDKFLRMIDSGKLGFDPWGQPLPMFDLHVPTPFSAIPKDTSLRDRWRFWRAGLDNSVSNFITMYRIARNRSFPWNPKARAFSPQIFRTSSTKPGTYLAPLRDIALEAYKQINTAIATNDANTLHILTDGAFQKRALTRMKTLHPTSLTKSTGSSKKAAPSRTKHIWRLHSLASPVKCVSIRGQQVHFGRTEPSFGTRWAVQACVRLDTWQSLSLSLASGPADAEPKRVLEYLVFEKRMWYDEPWMVRDQLWEGLLPQPKS